MRAILLALVVMLGLGSVGCATGPDTEQQREALTSTSLSTLDTFRVSNSSYYEVYIRTQVGIAIFPSIGNCGDFLGGAYGEGILFDSGKLAGYCTIEKPAIGLPFGGQAYSQIIFFQNKEAIEAFKRGETKGSASTSTEAIESDARGQVDYDNGVAVFFLDSEDNIYKAAIGGQKFSYLSKETVEE